MHKGVLPIGVDLSNTSCTETTQDKGSPNMAGKGREVKVIIGWHDRSDNIAKSIQHQRPQTSRLVLKLRPRSRASTNMEMPTVAAESSSHPESIISRRCLGFFSTKTT